MELEQLRAAWNDIQTPAKTTEEILLMLKENKHPVLKGIRRQFTFEIIYLSVFLLCYYTMLDGDKKPVFINLILIACVIFPLIHSIMGYRFSKYLVNGVTIKQSIEKYLAKVKIYAVVSIVSRLSYATGLLLFLTYGLNFNTSKYYLSMAIIIICLIIQIALLCRLWAKRLKKLKDAVMLFN